MRAFRISRCRQLSVSLLSFALALSIVLPPAPATAQKKKDKKGEEPMAAKEDPNAPFEPNSGKHHLCETQVYYFWKREPQVPKETATTMTEDKNLFKVLHRTIDESRLIQDEAKALLESRLERAKAEALASCREEHENYAGCLSGKLKSNRPVYQRMDFASRAAYMTAIKDDCARKSGSCERAETTAVLCRIEASPDLPPPPKVEEAEEDKKGKKKK